MAPRCRRSVIALIVAIVVVIAGFSVRVDNPGTRHGERREQWASLQGITQFTECFGFEVR